MKVFSLVSNLSHLINMEPDSFLASLNLMHRWKGTCLIMHSKGNICEAIRIVV